MECAVCYNDCAKACKLVCGHVFCTGCVKEWYRKGTGTGCPMCRRPMYFKGFHKARDQWDEEAYETRCAEVLSQALDASIEEGVEMAEMWPEEFTERIFSVTMDDIRAIEKTWRFLVHEGVCAEDIEYVLDATGDYYSDRHLDRYRWFDEPQKKWVSRYAKSKGASRCAKRARARQDAWFEVSFYVEL